MTTPDDIAFAEDDDTWLEADRVATGRGWEANEADLIEQAIAVPDDESEFDR
ncbi:hypothetical protein [Mycobacterium sp. 3519A]|jgi:hypothetical protein|uniref:hypothetical protein n=1 Tax=Mycobacterium sp. 3519A TaxID=2057184 RepID=UPI00190EFA17|nr:hypothetical protein [Mycobacterium sp. 3519A]